MRRSWTAILGLFAALLGVLLSIDAIIYQTLAQETMPVSLSCDHKTPSESIGACTDGVTLCRSYNAATCDGKPAHVVNEDFPTSCVDHMNTNCDEPLVECSATCVCIWDSQFAICKPDPTTIGVFVSRKRRVESLCD
jgi:hypothetical protein